jgi:hypothetical protein
MLILVCPEACREAVVRGKGADVNTTTSGRTDGDCTGHEAAAKAAAREGMALMQNSKDMELS